jgi:aspartyl-tRNA(Asn)/glutamyl-tRNA(Gln) amidotransferase subunit C
MAKFEAKDVAKLAELAHLSLSEAECESFSRELDEITAYAERIQALDTEDVTPMSHALLESGREGGSAARDDVPGESLPRDRVLEAAPDASDGLFKVPKVLP